MPEGNTKRWWWGRIYSKTLIVHHGILLYRTTKIVHIVTHLNPLTDLLPMTQEPQQTQPARWLILHRRNLLDHGIGRMATARTEHPRQLTPFLSFPHPSPPYPENGQDGGLWDPLVLDKK